MDAAKRRAYIKQQAAIQKQQGGQTLKGPSSAIPSSKRKQPEKTDREPSKKPKIAPEPILGLKVGGKKVVTKPATERERVL